MSVSDHGVGLSSDQAAHVFDRFYRASESSSGAPRGVGLGLFLCKRMVEAQGGRISVESSPGLGSTFRFTLPTLVENDGEAGSPVPSDVRVLDEPSVPVGVAR